ncbi:MAG: DUF4124 domain-containing protein [Pseudomonadota bacterium]|nr:DUF4124 domain-containing protein [Pseudomonadota bacterium]
MWYFKVVALSLLVVAGTAAAEIYRSVDERGNVTFSDSPTKNSERVNLPPLSIIPGMNPADIARANRTQGNQNQATRPNRYQLSFVSPGAGQVLHKPQDILEIAVKTDVPLANGDRMSLQINGRSLGEDASAAVATESLDRGEHTVTARVIRDDGRVVGEQSVTVFVQQPSALAPNRRKP